MSQIGILQTNMDKLTEKVFELKSKTFLLPPVEIPDIRPMLMTNRQIAKKMLLISAGAISATGDAVQSAAGGAQQAMTGLNGLGADTSNASQGINQTMSSKEMNFSLNAARMIGQTVTPEAAHFIIYGKFKRDSNGKLIDNEVLDPDCVFTKLAMPDSHPNMAEISKIVQKVLKAIKIFGLKQQELLEDVALTAISIPSTITSIAASVVILPPGAGIPTAFAQLQNLIASLMSLVSKISGLVVDIEPFSYLPVLIQAEKLDNILSIINGMITIVIATLSSIDIVLSIIPSMPSPPGQGGTPADPLTVDASMTPSEPQQAGVGNNISFKTTASGGSWEYIYSWKITDGTPLSTEKEFTLYDVSSNFDVKLIVKDKKDSSNRFEKTFNVRISPM